MLFSISNTIAALLSLFVVGKSTSGITLFDQCPDYNYFVYFIRRQCPASVGVDLRCVIRLPGDRKMSGLLNCATIDAPSHAHLHQLTTSEMMALTRRRDAYGRPWCMLTFFYSSHCVFSAKTAPTVFRVAPLFPKLTVVAVDVSTYSRNSDGMIAQYGVLSTPLMALWENGYLAYRLYDDSPMDIQRLVEKIRSKTDLTPLSPAAAAAIAEVEDERSAARSDEADSDNRLVIDDENSTENTDVSNATMMTDEAAFLRQFRYYQKETEFDWLFLISAIAALMNIGYFALNSEAAKQLSDRIYRRFPILNFLRIQ